MAKKPSCETSIALFLWIGVTVLATITLFWNNSHTPLLEFDEFYTAERSREMLVSGFPPEVQFNFSPSLSKPPLHYFLTAITLPNFESREAALRLWPTLYGIFSIAGAGLLATSLLRRWTLASPAASVILFASFIFWGQSRSALADTGVACFAVYTAICCVQARSNPRWWLLAGTAAALSGLQKLPIGSGLMAIALFYQVVESRSIKPLKSPWTWLGCALSIGPFLAWYLIQALRTSGTNVLRSMDGMYIRRATESTQGTYQLSFDYYLGIIVNDWLLLGTIGLAVIIATPFIKQFRRNPEYVTVIAQIAVYIFLLCLSSKHSERYLIAVYPMFATVMSIAIWQLLTPRKTVFGITVALLLLPVFWRWPSNLEAWDARPDPYSAGKNLAISLAQHVEPGEQLIVAVSEKTWPELHLGTILFYADFDHSVWYTNLDSISNTRQYYTNNIRGIAHYKDRSVLEENLPGFKIVEQDEHIIHFTVKPRSE
ncbi:MAG: ArnT family glycosyltransferase [Puniceicoccales bacterium]